MNMKQMEAQIASLTKMVQLQQQRDNTPLGRQIRKQAEIQMNTLKTSLMEKQARKQQLEAMNHRTTFSSERGQTKFVKLYDVVSMYEVSDNGKVTKMKPVTAMTYSAMGDAERKAFDSEFPSISMAIEHGAYNPTMTQSYFDGAVIANGMDSKLFEMGLNRPTVEYEAEYHATPEVSNAYDSFDDYKKGLTREMKEYQHATSTEGKMAIGRELEQLNAEISELETEVGMSASYLDTGIE
ncbi:hypothetical protein [Fictibacillus enclensis]|uniref:hypothetical protein n=1 Tax=Fictibacillus enclensis TaxID=1017270 RepID=UPI0024C02954|nr:hypothetical protein [Fictibacillus enclensis]WHY74593.1 hypothetical protein QNH15_12085 [Fictibacillus enclensis]